MCQDFVSDLPVTGFCGGADGAGAGRGACGFFGPCPLVISESPFRRAERIPSRHAAGVTADFPRSLPDSRFDAHETTEASNQSHSFHPRQRAPQNNIQPTPHTGRAFMVLLLWIQEPLGSGWRFERKQYPRLRDIDCRCGLKGR